MRDSRNARDGLTCHEPVCNINYNTGFKTDPFVFFPHQEVLFEITAFKDAIFFSFEISRTDTGELTFSAFSVHRNGRRRLNCDDGWTDFTSSQTQKEGRNLGGYRCPRFRHTPCQHHPRLCTTANKTSDCVNVCGSGFRETPQDTPEGYMWMTKPEEKVQKQRLWDNAGPRETAAAAAPMFLLNLALRFWNLPFRQTKILPHQKFQPIFDAPQR